MAKANLSANCSILRCTTKHPHLENKDVKALMVELTDRPYVMAGYIAEGLAQLGSSACNDLANRNALGFITRQRQIQELHIRGFHLLLIAEPSEQAHMLSGDMPNGLAYYYRTVNKHIFNNQNDWEATTPGLNGGSFTIMETLHEGAHVSFKSLLMARGYFDHPTLAMTPERFAEFVNSLVKKFTYMSGMLKAGKSREHVLGGVQNLYRPASYWNEQQRIAKAPQQNPASDEGN